MRWSDIPFRPPAATLRWFGLLAFLFLAGLAGWQFFVRHNSLLAGGLLGLALVAAAVGPCFPMALRPVFVGWMVLVYPISWLVSHLVLAIVYYCLFTPVGLFFSLIGRDVLHRRFRPDQTSYWVVKPGGEELRGYFRQS